MTAEEILKRYWIFSIDNEETQKMQLNCTLKPKKHGKRNKVSSMG